MTTYALRMPRLTTQYLRMLIASAIFVTCTPLTAQPEHLWLSAEPNDCIEWLTWRGATFQIIKDFEPDIADGTDVVCEIEQPVVLSTPINGVEFDHDEMLMSCELARSVVRMTDVMVQYDLVFMDEGTPYNCRTISDSDRVSQHGHGRAIDLTDFRDSEGRVFDVEDHWEQYSDSPETYEGQVLHGLVHDLFNQGIFNVLLTPDYNEDHEDVFHFDLSPGYRSLD